MPELERAPQSGFEVGKDGTTVLVVGFDGSDPSRNALAYAAGLARRERARLLIAFVQPISAVIAYPGVCAPTPEDSGEDLREEVARELDGLEVYWSCVFCRGDAVCELERLAEEHCADAIVVGKSNSRLHALAGSVAVRLTRRAPCTVIVVP